MNTELENILTSEIDPLVSTFITRVVEPENQTAIQIKDRNLERCLKEHFGLSENEPITDKHMESLIVLDVSNQEIADLSGMEHAKNIENFRFNNNRVSDLSPLGELLNIKIIGADSNQISSLETLKDGPSLELLSLVNNGLTTLRRIAICTSLTHLWISRNQVPTLTELYNLHNLEMIEFNYNLVADISPLKNHVNLERIYGAHNQIRLLDDQLQFPKLSLLELGYNDFPYLNNEAQLQFLNKIAQFTTLEALGLSNNNLSTIEPLESLVNLRSVFLTANKLTSIDTLKNMPEISFLNARDQLVSPSVATVYTPFPLRIRDRFGQLPEIVFDHPGTYDGENVIWHEAGTNNLHWYTTGGASIEFSGTVIQQAIPDYRPSQPGRIRYTFNPRSTTVTWEPSVDHYGISHYEFYLWDFLIATTTEPEFIAEDIRHHGQYPITIIAVSNSRRKSDPAFDLIYRSWMPIN